jgi:hypothetical protein
MKKKQPTEWSFPKEFKGNHITVYFEGDELTDKQKKELKELVWNFLRSLRPDKSNLDMEVTE